MVPSQQIGILAVKISDFLFPLRHSSEGGNPENNIGYNYAE